MNDCKRCIHYRILQNEARCVRDMTLATGSVLSQRNTGRMASKERDERLVIWRKGSLQRKGGDVCGVKGRHWVAK